MTAPWVAILLTAAALVSGLMLWAGKSLAAVVRWTADHDSRVAVIEKSAGHHTQEIRAIVNELDAVRAEAVKHKWNYRERAEVQP